MATLRLRWRPQDVQATATGQPYLRRLEILNLDIKGQTVHIDAEVEPTGRPRVRQIKSTGDVDDLPHAELRRLIAGLAFSQFRVTEANERGARLDPLVGEAAGAAYAAGAGRARRRRHDDREDPEFLEEVADVCRRALAAGETPVNWVAEEWGKSVPTAHRYITSARRLGLLD